MIEVNLLPSKNVLSRREANLRGRLLSFVAILALILLLDLASFFIVSQVLTRQINGEVATRSNLLATVESLSSVADGLRTVRQKADGVAVILATRPNMVAAVTEITKLNANNLEVSNFQVGDSGALSFGAKVGDTVALGQFIDQITAEVAAGRLSKVSINGLRQDGDAFSFNVSGSYVFEKTTK